MVWGELYILPCYPVSDDLDSKRRFSHSAKGLLDEVLIHVWVQLNTNENTFCMEHIQFRPKTNAHGRARKYEYSFVV